MLGDERRAAGLPFDIHTGGIDHREIHHPNEIAQNQAFCCTNGLDVPANSGAKLWMHNNFLVERSGKMSKSSGEFLRLQLLIDKGYHPLAYRLLCLQAHYRSELEFSWEGLGAALTRLKRLVMAVAALKAQGMAAGWVEIRPFNRTLRGRVSDDLNTPVALSAGGVAAEKGAERPLQLAVIAAMDAVLGLNLLDLSRTDLRLRPASATITEAEIEAVLADRKEARGPRISPVRRAARRAGRARRGGDGRRPAGLGLEAGVRLWRLTRAAHVALDGAGALAHGGRYSPVGVPVVSLASEAGLAVLVALRYLPQDRAQWPRDAVLGWTEADATPNRARWG
jgi:hypothetical protein